MTTNNENTESLILKRDSLIKEMEELNLNEVPSEKDQKWALDLLTPSRWIPSGGQATKFFKAVSLGNLWRVAYAIKFNDGLGLKHSFISKQEGRKALYLAANKNHDRVVGHLLKANFAHIYGYDDKFLKKLVKHKDRKSLTRLITDGDYSLDDGRLLVFAGENGQSNICLHLLNLGVKADKALTETRNIAHTYATRIIKNAVTCYKKENSIAKTPVKEIAPPKKIDLDKMWAVMDDNTIVKYESIPYSDTKLETIFNFEACNIRTICLINNSAPATMVIQNFRDIENDRILSKAWQALKDLGRNPVPFTGNDNFIVLKPDNQQKLKIEK